MRPDLLRRPRGSLWFAGGLLCGVLWALSLTLAWRDRDLELLRQVVGLTEDEWIGEARRPELVDDALRGMLGGLDRYSAYYGPDEIARLDRETSGTFRGIGVVFLPPAQEGVVLFPVPGGPAARAGLRVGDRIRRVDGLELAALPAGGLPHYLQGSGPELALDVEGLDGAARALSVTPEVVLDPTVRHARIVDAASGVGYLAVVSFSHRTAEEFDRAVAELRGEGLRALVVDLRHNPGGILDAAVELANRFVAEGVLVSTETRRGSTPMEADPAKAALAGMPLVLLVDGGSASASEVLAGALQDHAAGVLVGEDTYGKGTVQTLTRLGEARAIVKLTTARYLTPSGRRIERHEDGDSGLAPDVQVALPAEQKDGVLRFLASYSPPAGARAAIEAWEESSGKSLLGAPPPDRQLEVAVRLLNGEAPDGERLH